MLMYVYPLISIITGWVVWYKGHERGLELVWGGWWACWAWIFCWFCWTGLGCVHLWRSSSAGGFPRLKIFETSLLSSEGDSKPQHCGEWTLSLLKIIKWSMIVPETKNMNFRQWKWTWLTQNKKKIHTLVYTLGTKTHLAWTIWILNLCLLHRSPWIVFFSWWSFDLWLVTCQLTSLALNIKIIFHLSLLQLFQYHLFLLLLNCQSSFLLFTLHSHSWLHGFHD